MYLRSNMYWKDRVLLGSIPTYFVKTLLEVRVTVSIRTLVKNGFNKINSFLRVISYLVQASKPCEGRTITTFYMSLLSSLYSYSSLFIDSFELTMPGFSYNF